MNLEWTPSETLSFRNDAYAIHQYRDIIGYQHQFGDHGFAATIASFCPSLR